MPNLSEWVHVGYLGAFAGLISTVCCATFLVLFLSGTIRNGRPLVTATSSQSQKIESLKFSFTVLLAFLTFSDMLVGISWSLSFGVAGNGPSSDACIWQARLLAFAPICSGAWSVILATELLWWAYFYKKEFFGRFTQYRYYYYHVAWVPGIAVCILLHCIQADTVYQTSWCWYDEELGHANSILILYIPRALAFLYIAVVFGMVLHYSGRLAVRRQARLAQLPLPDQDQGLGGGGTGIGTAPTGNRLPDKRYKSASHTSTVRSRDQWDDSRWQGGTGPAALPSLQQARAAARPVTTTPKEPSCCHCACPARLLAMAVYPGAYLLTVLGPISLRIASLVVDPSPHRNKPVTDRGVLTEDLPVKLVPFGYICGLLAPLQGALIFAMVITVNSYIRAEARFIASRLFPCCVLPGGDALSDEELSPSEIAEAGGARKALLADHAYRNELVYGKQLRQERQVSLHAQSSSGLVLGGGGNPGSRAGSAAALYRGGSSQLPSPSSRGLYTRQSSRVSDSYRQRMMHSQSRLGGGATGGDRSASRRHTLRSFGHDDLDTTGGQAGAGDAAHLYANGGRGDPVMGGRSDSLYSNGLDSVSSSHQPPVSPGVGGQFKSPPRIVRVPPRDSTGRLQRESPVQPGGQTGGQGRAGAGAPRGRTKSRLGKGYGEGGSKAAPGAGSTRDGGAPDQADTGAGYSHAPSHSAESDGMGGAPLNLGPELALAYGMPAGPGRARNVFSTGNDSESEGGSHMSGSMYHGGTPAASLARASGNWRHAVQAIPMRMGGDRGADGGRMGFSSADDDLAIGLGGSGSGPHTHSPGRSHSRSPSQQSQSHTGGLALGLGASMAAESFRAGDRDTQGGGGDLRRMLMHGSMHMPAEMGVDGRRGSLQRGAMYADAGASGAKTDHGHGDLHGPGLDGDLTGPGALVRESSRMSSHAGGFQFGSGRTTDEEDEDDMGL